MDSVQNVKTISNCWIGEVYINSIVICYNVKRLFLFECIKGDKVSNENTITLSKR